MSKRDYMDFQDRSHPLAYLITVRTYGTWLHGDERGSVHRRSEDQVVAPGSSRAKGLYKSELAMRKGEPFVLANEQRDIVSEAIEEVCRYRNVALFGLNVRSNHFHAVPAAVVKPEQLMTAFKAYATRALRAKYGGAIEKVWARHGSTRYLWTEEQVGNAVAYVKFEQGDHLEL